MASSQPYIKWSDRHRLWTPESRERLRVLAATMNDLQIAAELHCSESSVSSMRNRLGISPVRRRNLKWTPEQKDQLARWAADFQDSEIAARLGITAAAVRRARIQLDIVSAANPRRGRAGTAAIGERAGGGCPRAGGEDHHREDRRRAGSASAHHHQRAQSAWDPRPRAPAPGAATDRADACA
jgi:transposase-like protein